MILNNYWAWKLAIERTNEIQSDVGSKIDTTIISTSGVNIGNVYFGGYNGYNTRRNTILNYNLSHIVSDDTTEISPEDYRLTAIANTTNVSTSATSQNVDNHLKYTITCSGRNDGGAPITITRIGIVKTYLGSSNRDALLIIADLPEPITVPANQGYLISVDLEQE